LPFVPGKTIKGLVREAVEDYAALKEENIKLEEAFGVEASQEGSTTIQKGYLYFTNAELSKDEAQAIITTHAEDFLYINKVDSLLQGRALIYRYDSIAKIIKRSLRGGTFLLI